MNIHMNSWGLAYTLIPDTTTQLASLMLALMRHVAPLHVDKFASLNFLIVSIAPPHMLNAASILVANNDTIIMKVERHGGAPFVVGVLERQTQRLYLRGTVACITAWPKHLESRDVTPFNEHWHCDGDLTFTISVAPRIASRSLSMPAPSHIYDSVIATVNRTVSMPRWKCEMDTLQIFVFSDVRPPHTNLFSPWRLKRRITQRLEHIFKRRSYAAPERDEAQRNETHLLVTFMLGVMARMVQQCTPGDPALLESFIEHEVAYTRDTVLRALGSTLVSEQTNTLLAHLDTTVAVPARHAMWSYVAQLDYTVQPRGDAYDVITHMLDALSHLQKDACFCV